MLATGTFDVTLTPLESEDGGAGAALSRLAIEKRLSGDLEGSSAGEMLSAISGVPGSAGYVALERVAGRLGGRRGTFVLQHSGTMCGERRELDITVVPDSATGELAGLSGRMAIDIVDGEHRYRFDYELERDS